MFAFGITATLILASSFSVMRIAIPRLVDEGFACLSEGDNYAAMGALVANRFLELTVGEALEALIEQQVPCGPILSAEEAIVDPQAVYNGTIQTFQHPAAGTIQAAKPAAHFSKTEVEMAKWFTARGENNAELLKSIGRTDEEIAALESQGFIGT